MDEKNSDMVSEILATKYSIGKDFKIRSFPMFESCPELINIEMNGKISENVTNKLSFLEGRRE